MDRLSVAVIDTGIDPAHPALPPIVGGARFSLDAHGRINVSDDWHDRAGHGTACAGVATRGLGDRAELWALKVVDDQRGASVRVLAAAIAWAVDRGARVVNASLGAPVWQDEARERLGAVCAEARRRGVVIVAAAGPTGTRALPAALDEVIAVGSAVCPAGAVYVADEDDLDLRAKGDLQRAPWLGGQTVLAQGTSLAAAHVTNAVCRILLSRPSLDADGVRAALEAQAVDADGEARGAFRRAVDTFYRGRGEAKVAWLRRAAIYPFNKETHALVRYRALLPFSIVSVADPPGKRLSGRDAAEILGDPPAGLRVSPSYDRALDEADGVVLGHLEGIAGEGARAQLRALVTKAVSRGKGVVSLSRLDPDVVADAEKRGVPAVDPTVSRAEVAPILGARLGASEGDLARDPRLGDRLRRRLRSALIHDCPVLAILGTSRSQGKLSLQLALKSRLREMGYRLGHLCTEPTGMLFGASATLPTGYQRGDDLSTDETATLTHLLCTEIKNRERPDLLLVGGQSGVVMLSPSLSGLGLTSLRTLTFAAAAQPDACVLVCNTFDPPDHVERSRAAVEAVLQCPVIAAAFADQVWEEREWKGVLRRRPVRLAEDALAEKLGAWERRLGLPCSAVLSPAGQTRLARVIVDHFASAGAVAEML